MDFDFKNQYGRKEIYGFAYRTDYDLKKHAEYSGADLTVLDEEKKERVIPHVIEPTFGHGRTLLAVLLSAYCEDEMGGEKRVYLKLPSALAPVKVAVFPLLKNKTVLVEMAKKVYAELKKNPAVGGGAVEFDDNGNIGKRYRRQDEIGTPFCVTVDFETIEKDGAVTVRERDSGKQERVKTEELSAYLEKRLKD